MSVAKKAPLSPEEAREHALQRVREALRGLEFGTITITVHDGAVVQVERTERLRVRLQ
jgi:hypothetical protein